MILIIDDDIAVRVSLQLLLSSNKYDVTVAEGPEMALRIIRQDKPDLIMLDLNFTIETSGKEGLAVKGDPANQSNSPCNFNNRLGEY